MADVLVCVSGAERKKLVSIYPEYADKIIGKMYEIVGFLYESLVK